MGGKEQQNHHIVTKSPSHQELQEVLGATWILAIKARFPGSTSIGIDTKWSKAYHPCLHPVFAFPSQIRAKQHSDE